MEPLKESFPAGRPGADPEMGILEPSASPRKAPAKTGWEIPGVAFPTGFPGGDLCEGLSQV